MTDPTSDAKIDVKPVTDVGIVTLPSSSEPSSTPTTDLPPHHLPTTTSPAKNANPSFLGRLFGGRKNKDDTKNNNGDDESEPDATQAKKQDPPAPKVSVISLFRFASPLDKFLIFVGSITAASLGAALPVMTIVFGDLLNALITYRKGIPGAEDKLNEDVRRGVIYLCSIGAAAFVLAYSQMAMWMWSAENQARRIRLLFLRSILRQDIAWFDRMETGDLTARLTADINLIQEGMSEKAGLIIQYSFTFISGFVVAYTKGWRLALVVTAVFPLIAAAGGFMSVLLAKGSTEGQTVYAAAGAIAQQTFMSIRTVTAFNGQSKEAARYASKLADAEKIGLKKAWYNGFGLATIMAVIFCSYALAFWYGSTLIPQGIMTGGEVVNVFFSIIIGAFSIGSAGPGLTALSTAQGAAHKIFEIIDRQSEIDYSDQKGEKPAQVKGEIVFKDVGFHYPQRPDVPILSSFSLTIKPGTTVALVGASGSGKSTIIKLITRFYNPTAGSVTLDSTPLDRLNLSWLRGKIGVVGQEPVLFERSVRENILLGLDREEVLGMDKDTLEKRIIEACVTANAWSFIKKLPRGLDTPVGEAGGMLSGGQKQRIAIARAIIRNPQILLLDEATSALDTESEKIVQAALEKASVGRTTVVIAHRLSTVRNADKIVVM
ncbi:ATP-binding cassette, sub-B (MDR TAP), member 4, partial [Quaeritorhiza haematococci]